MLTGNRRAYSFHTQSPTQGLSQLAADVLAQLGELALILLCTIRKAARKLTLHTNKFTDLPDSVHITSLACRHTRARPSPAQSACPSRWGWQASNLLLCPGTLPNTSACGPASPNNTQLAALLPFYPYDSRRNTTQAHMKLVYCCVKECASAVRRGLAPVYAARLPQ